MVVPNSGISRRDLIRFGGLGSLAAAGVISLAGCSTAVKAPTAKATGPRTGKEVLVYMNPAHVYPAYKAVFSAFEKKHNVTVTVTTLQWADMATKLTAGFLSGNVPDLCEDNGPSTGWGVAGNVMSLNDFIAKDCAAMGFPTDFQTAAVQQWQANGKTYAVPLHLTCNGLVFYNKAMLDAAGASVPTTWSEFRQTAKSLTHGDVHGWAVNQDSSYSWPWLLQAGAEYYQPSTKQFLAPDDASVKTLQFLQDMVFADGSTPLPVASTDPTGPQKLFSAKQVAMMISGPWDINPIRTSSPDIDLALGAPLKGINNDGSIAGASLMIPAKAQNPDLAWELIKELTELKVELAATKQSGMTMPRKSWAEAPAVKDDPLLGVVAKALANIKSFQGPLQTNKNLNSINTAYTTAWQQIAIQHQGVQPSIDTFRNSVKAYV